MMSVLLLLKGADRLVGRLISTLLPRPVPHELQDPPHSVLVIRPGGIGDAVLLVPAVRALRARFPYVSIDILAERRNSGVFTLCPGIRSVRRYDVPSEFFDALHSRYDVVIDTEQWHRLSAVVARTIRAGVRIGYATNDRKRLFTHPVTYCQNDYETESFMRLLEPLGRAAEGEGRAPFLSISAREAETVDTFLAPLGGAQIVALFPGASITARRWGGDRFNCLAERLVEKGIRVVVVGGESERVDGQAIEAFGGLSLCGLTNLGATAAVLARSSLLVSGDSGILHIAVGLGIPTVSLFGPGREMKWAPRGENHIVINKHLPCSPCTTFGYTPKCPINARCMAEISVDEVEQAVLTLLDRKNFDKRQQKS